MTTNHYLLSTRVKPEDFGGSVAAHTQTFTTYAEALQAASAALEAFKAGALEDVLFLAGKMRGTALVERQWSFTIRRIRTHVTGTVEVHHLAYALSPEMLTLVQRLHTAYDFLIAREKVVNTHAPSNVETSLRCSHCGSTEVARERRPFGNDTCRNCGAVWKSV